MVLRWTFSHNKDQFPLETAPKSPSHPLHYAHNVPKPAWLITDVIAMNITVLTPPFSWPHQLAMVRSAQQCHIVESLQLLLQCWNKKVGVHGEGRKICMSTTLKLDRPNVEPTHSGSASLLLVSTAQVRHFPPRFRNILKNWDCRLPVQNLGFPFAKKKNEQTNLIKLITN